MLSRQARKPCSQDAGHRCPVKDEALCAQFAIQRQIAQDQRRARIGTGNADMVLARVELAPLLCR